jgi:hypothetical protein
MRKGNVIRVASSKIGFRKEVGVRGVQFLSGFDIYMPVYNFDIEA